MGSMLLKLVESSCWNCPIQLGIASPNHLLGQKCSETIMIW